MALIGLLSLADADHRNGIVLVEIERKAHKDQHEAIVYAATSRLRPILLTRVHHRTGSGFAAAGRFFQSMAVVIMFGLGFCYNPDAAGTSVIYACFHRKS